MRYSVELRQYSEDGDDYSEDYYEFETRAEQLHLRVKTEVRSIPY